MLCVQFSFARSLKSTHDNYILSFLSVRHLIWSLFMCPFHIYSSQLFCEHHCCNHNLHNLLQNRSFKKRLHSISRSHALFSFYLRLKNSFPALRAMQSSSFQWFCLGTQRSVQCDWKSGVAASIEQEKCTAFNFSFVFYFALINCDISSDWKREIAVSCLKLPQNLSLWNNNSEELYIFLFDNDFKYNLRNLTIHWNVTVIISYYLYLK